MKEKKKENGQRRMSFLKIYEEEMLILEIK